METLRLATRTNRPAILNESVRCNLDYVSSLLTIVLMISEETFVGASE